MVLSLLRLAELASGQITIDGEDIAGIPRSVIRRRISCLSQEPFLFTASIRKNADPLGEASDAEIITALERVGLWTMISGAITGSEAMVLNADLEESLLSHGQRQLFCLARVLLKKSSVLVLDEPTRRCVWIAQFSLVWTENHGLHGIISLDLQTDVQIQSVIRSEFKECTIIMVAHRIRTLLDFDRVAVVDAGQIAELGEPGLLLAQEGGMFVNLFRKEMSSQEPSS